MSIEVVPSIEQLKSDRPPFKLGDGEWEVLHFFKKHLAAASHGWTIYVQPHMNGLRPDFVLVHPTFGIGVFEVKEWAKDSREIRRRTDGTLMAKNRSGGSWYRPRDPIHQIYGYGEELSDLYCPSLSKSQVRNITSLGLIFVGWGFEELHQQSAILLGGSSLDFQVEAGFGKWVIAGQQALDDGRLDLVFPQHNLRQSAMNETVHDELDPFLTLPEHSIDQSRIPRLTGQQQKWVHNKSKARFRKIKGPAGSGKTLVLAGRANELATQGKDVLVVTFNITILNFIRDNVVRFGRGKMLDRITFLHFHGWAKRVLYQTGNSGMWKEAWDHQGETLPHDLEQVLAKAMKKCEEQDLPFKMYDALLVDEGQDFEASWWEVLKRMVRPGGERLLVADRTQDIYGKQSSRSGWTDGQMEGAGFRGKWAQLKENRRMPSDYVSRIHDFAAIFVSDGAECDLPSPTKDQTEVPTQTRWVQTTEDQALDAVVREVTVLGAKYSSKRAYFSSEGFLPGYDIAWADVAILTGKSLAFDVENALSKLTIRVQSVFHHDYRARRKLRFGFFQGSARMKLSTIHSYKGFESRVLVVHLTDLDSPKRIAEAYAALTRLKASEQGSVITVVCDWAPAADYGRTWDDFVDERKGLVSTKETLGIPESEPHLEYYEPHWWPIARELHGNDQEFAVEPGQDLIGDKGVAVTSVATITHKGVQIELVDGAQVAKDFALENKHILVINADDTDVIARIKEFAAGETQS